MEKELLLEHLSCLEFYRIKRIQITCLETKDVIAALEKNASVRGTVCSFE